VAEASSGLLSRPSERATLLGAWAVSVALPALGLVLLLTTPAADVRWEHHPSHFWLVLAAALTSAALAFQTSGIALRRADARLFLVSLAFLSAAGFLALHALATPGVLLDGPNQGFVVATPVGLLIAGLFAALSALRLPPERAAAVMRHARALRLGLLVAMAAWAALSLASIPPLDDPTPTERATGGLVIPAAIALALFAYAGSRYLLMAVRSGSVILLAVASACLLLAEAMVAVALARNWQLTWWEWHLLMLVAFGAIAFSARREESAERFSDLYLDHTVAGKREVSVLFADLGDTVNVAARLEGRAPTGGVVVGGGTLRAVPGLRATSLGDIEVKGKRDPVDAYLVDAQFG
jgi:adenylate cyclase